MYVRYRFNKKAWMTSDMFRDWLRSFDRQMRSRGRHVILLCDNAASHNCANVKLTNVKVHFLPPNTTSHIQPMDAGIIRTFKAHYKKYLVKHFIRCAEDDLPQTLNLREALRFVKTAWSEVKSSTIQNCYRHVDIIPTPSDPVIDEDDMALSELRQFLKRFPNENGDIENADDYINKPAPRCHWMKLYPWSQVPTTTQKIPTTSPKRHQLLLSAN
ncbi:tigger transposable element-derived protein 6-like [Haliotis asinina]|uniref:tigger transposable element-derived protein 6-like n=1 Tax=Haliotis asinina TaxID=109174 RepID=UPI00353185E0